MENFEYSVQLSDQDWAEFSAATDECGLLQAGLASGDELLSSDIDQGDSSGSSPPRPPPPPGQPAPGGWGCPGCEEEGTDARPQASGLLCEPVLALGAGQQTPSTSTRSGARQPCGFSPPSQSASLSEPASSRAEMQRLLQGPAPQGPAPSPPGEPPPRPEPLGHSAASQGPPSSPGTTARSPSRKKRRAAGAKGGGQAGAPAPVPPRPASPLLPEARPGEGLGLAGSMALPPAAVLGKGLAVATVEPEAGARPDEPAPASAQAPSTTQVLQQGPGLDLSPPVPTTEQGTDLFRVTPGAELHTVSGPAREAQPQGALSSPISQPQPKVALSTPCSKPQPEDALSTPCSKPQREVALSKPCSKPQPEVALSTLDSKPQPEVALSTPCSKPQPEVDPSTLNSKPQLSVALSTPSCKPNPDMGLSTPIPVDKPDVDSTAPASKASPHTVGSLPAPQAASELGEPVPARTVELGGSSPLSSRGHQEEPRGEPPLGICPAAKRKKVRFSVAEPGSEELGSGGATVRPAGGRGGPGAWDAVAVGPLQPRLLRQLPPPVPLSPRGSRPGSHFALTLPEAYEFLFCDTIEEEAEEAEEDVAGQALANVQWPDTCEFFFQDCRVQGSRPRGARSAATGPLPEDPQPISIPEAYEHFFGEEGRPGGLELASPRQLQAAEPPQWAPVQVRPGFLPKPSPATAQEAGPVVRWSGEPRGPLAAFTFSQDDMCLVFVAFATWAVRTSDLHTPDAWKTVLLANIGTISAIRYFRRQVERGRRSPGPGPSPSN
ncbi:PGC-1 and ERR-induced regulator in muscle protein 1 [Dasypus novemcinctus]|uniref:PGC-1 and ERR-induced regulator in muscle protein 1 n=1 Tax=Dasypus novemcinctus TaxID=9361 RepID=UPI00265F83D4|nr:PGC-1 and ERR-induced regulator in muscle protein 1 [Dasypus novemcinctus]XP_012376862.2 PGC-1 and ERR-induced regulator in muscle protein 1 [Dasypus novemcinctus]